MDELPYRRLEAWRKAIDRAEQVLTITRSRAVPMEPFLRDQVARAATSIPANLAEGHGRGTARDFAAFVDRARGSLFELDTWVELMRRTNPTDSRFSSLQPRIMELNAMLYALRASLRERARTQNQR